MTAGQANVVITKGTTVRQLAIDPRHTRVIDLVQIPEQSLDSSPDFRSYLPDDTIEQSDWSGGAFQWMLTPGSAQKDRYADASNVDASFPNVLMLSALKQVLKTTGGADLGVNITHMIEFKGNLFAFGGTKGFYWDIAGAAPALPNVFNTCGPTGATDFPATVTDVVVHKGYLAVALGTSNKYYYTSDSTPTLAGDWTQSTHADGYADKFAVLNSNYVYKAASATGSRTTCDVSQSTILQNASDWSLTANIGTTDADITGMKVKTNALVILKEDGIYGIDARGDSYEAAEELRRHRSTTLGNVSEVHKGALFFKYREQLGVWSGSQAMGLSNSNGIDLVGPSAALSPFTSSAIGSPQALLSAHPWLMNAVKTPGGKYYINKQVPVGGARGVHPWIDNSTTQISALYYLNRSSSTNSILIFSSGTQLAYLVMPLLADNPLVDGSSNGYKFAASGTIDFARMSVSSLLLRKVLVGFDIFTGNCAAGRTIQVSYGTDGTAPTTNLGSAITSNGLTQLSFPTEDNTVSARYIQLRLTFSTNDSSQSPLVYSIRPRFRTIYPNVNRWLVYVPAGEMADLQLQETPITVYTELRALKGNLVTFKDHHGTSWTATLDRVSWQSSDYLSGMEEGNISPELFIEVQLTEAQSSIA